MKPYSVHLDGNSRSSFHSTFGANTLCAANIASNIITINIRHRVVIRGHSNTLRAVHHESALSAQKISRGKTYIVDAVHP